MLLRMAIVVVLDLYDLFCRKCCVHAGTPGRTASAVLLMCWAHTCLSFVHCERSQLGNAAKDCLPESFA